MRAAHTFATVRSIAGAGLLLCACTGDIDAPDLGLPTAGAGTVEPASNPPGDTTRDADGPTVNAGNDQADDPQGTDMPEAQTPDGPATPEMPDNTPPDLADPEAGSQTEGDPGQQPEADPEPGRLAGITAAHNAVRAELDLPPLTWSNEIAAFAQQWADTLAGNCGVLSHRDQDLYGENLATYGARPSPPATTPGEAVSGWSDEAMCWDYGPFLTGDSCNPQCVSNLSSNGCGHYTQVVWRATTRLGCGVAECERDGFLFDLWVCNYDPPGNFVGQTPY